MIRFLIRHSVALILLKHRRSGMLPLTIEKVVLLAKYFHVSADYLLGITDDPTWRGAEEKAD